MEFRRSLVTLSLIALLALVLVGPAWAADGLQAVIKTCSGKTITVTSINPGGWIEFTPPGGKKTKVFFKDVASIEWDKETREHTITGLDGTTQKVSRAWIFSSNSSAYMQFTGTDEAGEDADGTISGSDIASIVFAKAATTTAAPTAAAPTDSPPAPTAAPAGEQAAPAEPAAAPQAIPTRPSKRLPTNNLDYARDAAKALDDQLPGLVERYAKEKSAGLLGADDPDEGLRGLKIQKEIHKLFSDLPRYYFAARKDGWEQADPELAPLKEKIVAARQAAAQADHWTCVDPADELGTTDETQFEYWDRMRLQAFGAMLWTTVRKDPQQGQEQMDKVAAEIAGFEEGWKTENQPIHPAFTRLKEEVARLQKECAGAFAGAGQAKDAALAAYEALRQERERLRETTYKIENGQCHPMNWAPFLDELEKYEKTESVVVQEKIAALGKTCGNNLETLEADMEKLLGKNPSGWDWSAEVKYFDTILKAIPTLRQNIAKDIAEQAAQNLQMMAMFDEAIRAAKFGELKDLVKLGLRYDPHNADLIDLGPKVEEAAAGDAAAIQKQIEERQWPGHHKGFAGPGSPDELAKAALDYFNSTCKPTEKALAACIVEPEWYCFKRNIFGQPVQWALTFWVAVDVQGETTPDIVYAWSISFITEEKVDVAKSPPFRWAAFNFKQKMKRANVPGLK